VKLWQPECRHSGGPGEDVASADWQHDDRAGSLQLAQVRQHGIVGVQGVSVVIVRGSLVEFKTMLMELPNRLCWPIAPALGMIEAMDAGDNVQLATDRETVRNRETRNNRHER
jgi:hypothetical protein